MPNYDFYDDYQAQRHNPYARNNASASAVPGYEMTNQNNEFDFQVTEEMLQVATLPEEGEYSFFVIDAQQGYYEGSAKMDPCPYVDVTIQLDLKDGGNWDIKHRFFINERSMRRVVYFFQSLGMWKDMNMRITSQAFRDAIDGSGICEIKHRTYTKPNGTQGKTAEVKQWINSEPDQTQATKPF